MLQLIKSFLEYLTALLTETEQKAFAFFDLVGIILFFFPQLAQSLTTDELLARTVGGFVFFLSFLLANFSLYRKLRIDRSDQADIWLRILEKSFNNPYGVGRYPFRNSIPNLSGFDEQGLPQWCSLYVQIEVANTGYEKGNLNSQIDEKKTKLPALFRSDDLHFECYLPTNVEPRVSFPVPLYCDVLTIKQEPKAFAQSLKALVKTKQGYQVVLHYKTKRVDGESEIRSLVIKGDLQDFYQKMLEYWDNNGFKELANLARSI
jgi:hypothetical protein